MNLVMPVKSKEGVRLTIAISPEDYARLEELKAKLLRTTGKKASTQELASEWIAQGIAAKESETTS